MVAPSLACYEPPGQSRQLSWLARLSCPRRERPGHGRSKRKLHRIAECPSHACLSGARARAASLQESWDEEVGAAMRMNTRRYQMLLSEAVEACLPEPDADLAERDVLDVLLEQRLQRGDGEQVSTPASTRLRS